MSKSAAMGASKNLAKRDIVEEEAPNVEKAPNSEQPAIQFVPPIAPVRKAITPQSHVVSVEVVVQRRGITSQDPPAPKKRGVDSGNATQPQTPKATIEEETLPIITSFHSPSNNTSATSSPSPNKNHALEVMLAALTMWEDQAQEQGFLFPSTSAWAPYHV